MKYYVAFDIGGTHVKHAMLSEIGEILSKDHYATPIVDYELFISKLIEIVEDYQKVKEISGIAISLPGLINAKTGYSEIAGAIVALSNKNLKEILVAEFKLPVAIENDANCAALAEKFLGSATECQDFVCMTIGTGIGGGIFVNGKILHGHRFRAGEFGMMHMKAVDDPYTNMHFTSSTFALINSYKKYKNIPFEEMIEGYVVFEEAEHDTGVKNVVDTWLKYLSYSIFNLVCILDPEKVFIGGGISSKEGLIEMIEEKLDEISDWQDFKVPIECCHFRNDAGLIGALYHFLQEQK